MPDEAPRREWVDATAAAVLLGVGRHQVSRLAQQGLLTVRDLPGVRARYLRADVERLAREAVRPAVASSPGATDHVP